MSVTRLRGRRVTPMWWILPWVVFLVCLVALGVVCEFHRRRPGENPDSPPRSTDGADKAGDHE
ncbi:MAG: hypothetical protein JO222_15725 [Frankiales bacterium]|nr:hypothetical protein [Frankiales bacterium]